MLPMTRNRVEESERASATWRKGTGRGAVKRAPMRASRRQSRGERAGARGRAGGLSTWAGVQAAGARLGGPREWKASMAHAGCMASAQTLEMGCGMSRSAATRNGPSYVGCMVSGHRTAHAENGLRDE